MCGIVGTIGIHGTEQLNRMNEMQIHRGPDQEGYYYDQENDVALAMRRLSIVDLESGQQPMTNETQDIYVVFNGEIFNAPDIREALIRKGHVFKTKSSDTEVLVHLYEEMDTDMLVELNGMFAFIIYDKSKRRIFFARDYAGMKPLYYSFENSTLLLASELKSIVSVKKNKLEIDYQSVADYLSLQFVPAPQTIYKGVKKLGAGQAGIYSIPNKELSIYKYYDVSSKFQNVINNYKQASEVVRNSLERAVINWSMSDVPMSCLLSGGIDSTAIVSLYTVMTGECANTFTLGFTDDSNIDERELARATARKYHTNHTEILIDEKELVKDLWAMVKTLDEPYAGGIPSWFMYKKIGEKYKVTFTGVGGDELFGNYGKWIRYIKVYQRIIAEASEVNRGASLGDIWKNPYGSIYHKYIPEKLKRGILRQEVPRSIDDLYQQMIERIRGKECKDWRNIIPAVDFEMQLPDEFLFMTDRFSMNFSVEARTPFLDKEMMEAVFSIAPNVRTNRKELKGLLIAALQDLLPDEIKAAPKRGFVVPYEKWLRGELKQQTRFFLSKKYIQDQGIFNEKVVDLIVNPFYQGKSEYTAFVWTLLMFQLWYEQMGKLQ